MERKPESKRPLAGHSRLAAEALAALRQMANARVGGEKTAASTKLRAEVIELGRAIDSDEMARFSLRRRATSPD